MDTAALTAVRRLASERVTGLVVVDQAGRPTRVLPATQVLRLGLPRYCVDDPTLARVIDEAHADVFFRELADRTLSDALPRSAGELPVVDQDATVLEIAALMARTGCPLVPVVDSRGVMTGAVTLPTLLDWLLPQ
jgi:predicted transcriptional regulator